MAKPLASTDIEKIDARLTAEHILRFLSGRESDICKARFEGLTLKEAGLEFGLSPERIRQIELRAIRKMQAYWRSMEHASLEPLVPKACKPKWRTSPLPPHFSWEMSDPSPASSPLVYARPFAESCVALRHVYEPQDVLRARLLRQSYS